MSRKLDSFAVCVKPLVATAPDHIQLEKAIENVRARLAFYASTPAYMAAFEAHGFGALADQLAAYSRARRWEEMSNLITDEVLHIYATIGTWDEIAERLHARYGGAATNVEFSIPVTSIEDSSRLIKVVGRLRSRQEGTPGVDKVA